jgi:hypothetical protein
MPVKPRKVNKTGGEQIEKENYFGEEQEYAVRIFLSATTIEEKNKIYNEYLRNPLEKMISSIIRRYKLYRKDMDFKEIHSDTHSFLMTKVEKFKPSREKKAYSYFGTICKNYLMGQIIKDQKEKNKKISYEDVSSSLENNYEMSYMIENYEVDEEDIVKNYLINLIEFAENSQLNENEKRLAYGLIELFSNYEILFYETKNNKFNKNLILLTLRELTNLSTKEIRTSIKKFKNLYNITLKNIID